MGMESEAETRIKVDYLFYVYYAWKFKTIWLIDIEDNFKILQC